MKKLLETAKNALFYKPGMSRGYLAAHWLINLGFLALWCLGIGIVGLYLGKVNYGMELFISYFQHRLLFLLNIIPGFIVAALLLCITGRIWPAVLSSGLVVLSMAIGNHYKILLRDDPLLMEDLANLKEAAQISGSYTIELSAPVVLSLIAFILAMVIAVFLMRLRIRHPALRIGGLAATVLFSLLLWNSFYLSDEIYDHTSNLDVKFASGRALNQWSDTDKYCCRGFIYPFLHSAGDIVDLKPEGYNRRSVEAELAAIGDEDIPEGEKVNIISIMLEAYCDFSVYENIAKGSCDAYDFFHRLQSESVHGTLLTNIFAGGTINTERCYIAGSTQMYKYRKSADSFARYFLEQGYRTEFCHPGFEWFYNRQNVMEYLGFESCYFRENRYAMDGEIMPDAELFADIISLYEESKAAGEPYFNFTVTYQNHGPYPDSYFTEPKKVFTSSEGLSIEAYRILSNYLEGISRTDAALEDMVEYFRAEEEPVILVLFGDHKPWLGDSSYVYSELGLDLSLSSMESFYNYFATPYVIWANDAAKETLGNDFVGEGGDISPCFLMMKLFDLAGWQGEAYMQVLRELYDCTTVATSSGIYMRGGKTSSYINSTDMEKLLKVEQMQYYRMNDSQRGE